MNCILLGITFSRMWCLNLTGRNHLQSKSQVGFCPSFLLTSIYIFMMGSVPMYDWFVYDTVKNRRLSNLIIFVAFQFLAATTHVSSQKIAFALSNHCSNQPILMPVRKKGLSPTVEQLLLPMVRARCSTKTLHIISAISRTANVLAEFEKSSRIVEQLDSLGNMFSLESEVNIYVPSKKGKQPLRPSTWINMKRWIHFWAGACEPS